VILIVGGSGALGSAIARRLLRSGEFVRVMTRNPTRAAGLSVAGAEVVQGDLLDRESLVRACGGAGHVIAAAHSMLGRGPTASVHVDGRGHRDLIDVARAAGVSRFLYTSVYDYGPPYRDVSFFKIKFEVEEHLKSSGLNHTILRPTAFMETHAHQIIGASILKSGRAVLFGSGEQPRNFVAADDVAQIAVRALDDPTLSGQTIDVGGEENLTDMDVVRLYERLGGRKATVFRIPIGVLRGASVLIRPVHPGVSQVISSGVLAATVDQRFDARPLLQRFPIRLTRLEDWVTQRVGHVTMT
jgi:uncharacterized protein YbjT (DUF2867 family)